MTAGDRALWTLTHFGGWSSADDLEWTLANVADCHDVLRYTGERGRHALSMALIGTEVRAVHSDGGITISITAEQLVAVRDAAVISL